MTDRVEIDPEALVHAADVTEVLETGVRSVAENLRARLTSLETGDGQPWGDDKMGDQFVANYRPGRDNLLDGMDAIAEMLNQFVTGMRDANAMLTGADSDAAYTFGPVDPTVPNVVNGKPPRQPQPVEEEA